MRRIRANSLRQTNTLAQYLGHDLLLRNTAKEMNDVWSCHVDYEILKSARADGKHKPIEEIDIPPLNREQAKAEAWQAAMKGCEGRHDSPKR